MKVKECDFKTALKYVCEILNIRIDTFSATQGLVITKADWDIFEKFDKASNNFKIKRRT